MHRWLLLACGLPLVGCSSPDTVSQPLESCAGALEAGSADGHADPFGAKVAGEARAARLTDAAAIAPPAHGRQQYQDGDFVLVNDKIAVVIEDAGTSDGYGRFGGEILGVDAVGDDGLPEGRSRYVETLMGLGLMLPKPEPGGVTVLSDGSDGGEAVVRVIGKLAIIPFLEGSFAKLFKSDYDLTVAYDYVLKPGWEKVLIRVSVVNATDERIDFGEDKTAKDELYGFFQSNHNELVTAEHGFGDPEGEADFVGFAGHDWSFAWRAVEGPVQHGLDVSGFVLFHGTGFAAESCAITTEDRVELIAGGPYYDGLREAVRRVDDAEPWREITGTLKDADGKAMAGQWVHALDEDDVYLSRTKTGDDGGFTIHAPPGQAVQLHATAQGYLHQATTVAAGDSSASLAFEPEARLHVTAEDGDKVKLPVRVQIVPKGGFDANPKSYGVAQEVGGRLYQQFVMNGDATLVVPPGEHRVIVTRGYEYELFDTTVTVAAGETAEVAAVLEHSVDSTGMLCADFHIHSHQSADSSDPIDFKVRGAIADGLDIPVSSEHEWVVDFGPIVKQLGMEKWAFGMASTELTTFSWGHFGVVPMAPERAALNNGAIDWVGRTPPETFGLIDELQQKPALIVNHPRSGLGGYFSSVQLDQQGNALSEELWSENFDAVEVFNDSGFDANETDSVEDWFALLNRGLRVSAVGSSDSHHLRTSPVGYPRTCFPFGHDDPQKLTPSAVRDAILAGSATISGGLLMKVAGPGDVGPGGEVGAGKQTFAVTVHAPSWIEADELEAYVNGEKAYSEKLVKTDGVAGNLYEASVEVELASGGWVVFHARGKTDLAPLHPGRNAFAVSNPIFAKP